MSCALWIPEVKIANVDRMEPVPNIDAIHVSNVVDITQTNKQTEWPTKHKHLNEGTYRWRDHEIQNLSLDKKSAAFDKTTNTWKYDSPYTDNFASIPASKHTMLI